MFSSRRIIFVWKRGASPTISIFSLASRHRSNSAKLGFPGALLRVNAVRCCQGCFDLDAQQNSTTDDHRNQDDSPHASRTTPATLIPTRMSMSDSRKSQSQIVSVISAPGNRKTMDIDQRSPSDAFASVHLFLNSFSKNLNTNANLEGLACARTQPREFRVISSGRSSNFQRSSLRLIVHRCIDIQPDTISAVSRQFHFAPEFLAAWQQSGSHWYPK
ncbi:hypothetical protein D9758_005789 [Tetrapyrgos nigripes]|uniref:Uncharacterized protein n=1 Tax=Tetrapyrgos nigripes TaxID=182062 RepID=A0A8H5GJG4_9AGAR|nr:hypothetical protein D9758_005789 [Tetrapyrgos nigripes]